MATGGRKALFELSAGIVAVGLVTLATLGPASAQGIFESIFGGLRRTIERPTAPLNVHAFAEPFTSLARAINSPPLQQRAGTGPAEAFCVRTCDGHYFPVRAHAGLSAAESCRAFCPASQTRLYSGSNIDYAVASDGSRYGNLDNAYVYRRHLVAGCTCNGRDQFGLAHIDVNSDPTLRPGDVVATKSGLIAFSGAKNKAAEFTPVESYSGFSKSYRDKLSEIKISPPNPGAANFTSVMLPLRAEIARGDDRHSAQLER